MNKLLRKVANGYVRVGDLLVYPDGKKEMITKQSPHYYDGVSGLRAKLNIGVYRLKHEGIPVACPFCGQPLKTISLPDRTCQLTEVCHCQLGDEA